MTNGKTKGNEGREPTITVGMGIHKPSLRYKIGNTLIEMNANSRYFKWDDQEELVIPVEFLSQIPKIVERVHDANREYGLQQFVSKLQGDPTYIIYNSGGFQVEQAIYLKEVNALVRNGHASKKTLETFCHTFKEHGFLLCPFRPSHSSYDKSAIPAKGNREDSGEVLIPVKNETSLAKVVSADEVEIVMGGLSALLRETDPEWHINVLYSDQELESEKPKPKLVTYPCVSHAFM